MQMTGHPSKYCGSLEIANDVLSHLMQAGLSGTEWCVAFAVLQKTSSGGERTVSISLRRFCELVCLDQETIRKGLKTLRERNILVRNEPPSFIRPASWSFNENWATWISLESGRVPCQNTPLPQHTECHAPAQGTVLQQHTVSVSGGREAPANTRVAPEACSGSAPATMNNNHKQIIGFDENRSSPRSIPSAEAMSLAGHLRDAVRVRDPKAKAGRTEDLTTWARDIDLLMRIDQRSPDEIRRVITWCQMPGGFWGPNILSGRKLREKFDTLSGQMMRETCEARYGRLNGNYRVPQILNNRAEREYIPVKEPVRI